MKRKLRRFGHRADEQQQCDRRGTAALDPGKQGNRGRRLCGHGEQLREFERAVEQISQHRAGEERDVAGPQKRKGSEGAVQGCGVSVVMNQEIQQIRQDLPEHK